MRAWLEKIRNKPREQKMRLVWILVGAAAVLLVFLWIILGRSNKNIPGDNTLFHTIGQGFKDIKNNYKK